jgi:phage baseplate assembly protein W
MAVTGVLYPLQVDGGNLAIASDADLVASQIRSMLETEPLENPMRPGYGIPNRLFDSLNDNSLITGIQERLTAEIPLASFVVTGEIWDDGAALVEVAWRYQGEAQEPIQLRISA